MDCSVPVHSAIIFSVEMYITLKIEGGMVPKNSGGNSQGCMGMVS
jgi:hypothetical protein